MRNMQDSNQEKPALLRREPGRAPSHLRPLADAKDDEDSNSDDLT